MSENAAQIVAVGGSRVRSGDARKKCRRPRRIRTARNILIEFFLVPDALWALVLAGLLTTGLYLIIPMSASLAWLTFAVLLVKLFLLFWLALINCNPYPLGCTVFEHFRSMSRALPTEPVTRGTDLSVLKYPIIFKPSLCSTNSSGVKLIHSAEEARAYMKETQDQVVCAEEFQPGEEYTIMWERWPWRRRGRVINVNWRQKTHPPGEFHPLSGTGTPKVTVRADHFICPELEQVVEQMVAHMPNVYCTRFDVRAAGDAELRRGDFWVLESNGTIGVPPGRSLLYVLCVHWPKRMVIGLYNILTHRNASIHPRVLVHRMRRFKECGGWDFRICDGF